MDEIIKQFAAELPYLPSRLQDFIRHDNWEDKLIEIGRRYQLDSGQIHDLKIEVALVLFGLEELNDFGSNIKKAINLPTTDQLINGVRERVFRDVEETILKLNTEQQAREQKINDRYSTLPTSIREVLSSMDTEAKTMFIAQQHNLHIDQMGKLNEEATKVILGQTTATQFPKQLQTSLGIDMETATKISEEINKQIFLPIRIAMRDVEKPDLSELSTAAPPNNLPVAPEGGAKKTAPSGEAGQPNMFEQKLGGHYKLPRVEIATKKNFGSPIESLPVDTAPKHVDPYREPTN
ncbi:MAG: hypothetical protein U9M92_01520 [Patescibacteria group bacterium]|nr:hypothetical protein [Patescibacteria group bacterium]